MRFLADENFPGDSVSRLAAHGHDVTWIRTEAPGIADTEVLARANHERRILLTFDKDFGELGWGARLGLECGVVLFRMLMPAASLAGEKIVSILESRADWIGHFSVVEPGRVRMRPLIPRS